MLRLTPVSLAPVFLTVVGLLGACGGQSLRVTAPGLGEGSGLVQSRRTPGVFWTHNDSTDTPCPGDTRLFAVTAEGEALRVVKVLDSCNVDWEDIAADDTGHLYVADSGNNKSDRRDLMIYRLPEPRERGRTVRPDRRIRYHYAEQTAFPDPERRFDAEALFWAPNASGVGTLYLLTKHRGDQRTVLYRFDDLSGADEVVPVRISEFDVGGNPERFGGMVTAADATPNGRYLAVLTYHALFVFQRPESGDDYLSRPVSRLDFDQDVTVQAEAVAWDGDAILFTNEDGALFRVEDPLKSGRFPR